MMDCIIIGAGPAGISAAIYLKRANKNIMIVDNTYPCSTLMDINSIENYPAVPSISGQDLANKFYEHMLNLNINYKKGNVLKIEKNDDFKVLIDDKVYETKNIILAVGKSYKKLGLNEEKYIGRGISYCVKCDGYFYKDKIVGVVGSSKQALEDAKYLLPIANKVYLFGKLKSDNVITISTPITDLVIENEIVRGVINNNKKIDLDCLFVVNGTIKNDYFNLELNITNNLINVDNNYETNIKGIYAIGDCINKELYQIVTATNDGAIVADVIIKRSSKF